MASVPILLGMNGFMQYRNSTQKGHIWAAATPMLDKGGDLVCREDLIWANVEPTEGASYDWTIPDAMATAAANAGWRMWWIPSKPPAWATAPGGSGSNGYACAPYPGVLTLGGNSALDAYAAFCGAAADRYGPGGAFWASYGGTDLPIAHMEIWNEEYTPAFCKLWDGDSAEPIYSRPADYAAMFNAASAEIAASNAAVMPVACITYQTWNSSPVGAPYLVPFLDALTVPLRGVTSHPYTQGWTPASFVPSAPTDKWKYFTAVDLIRTKLVERGMPNTGVYITEMGWPGGMNITISGTVYNITEADQAANFTELWSMVQAMPYVKGLMPFCITNPGAPGVVGTTYSNPENYYGFWHTVSGDAYDIGTAKPVVATVTALPAITRTVNATVVHSPTQFDLPDPAPGTNQAATAAYVEQYVATHGGGSGPVDPPPTGGGTTAGLVFADTLRPKSKALYPPSDIVFGSGLSQVAPTFTSPITYRPLVDTARFRLPQPMVYGGGGIGDMPTDVAVCKINGAANPQAITSYAMEQFIYSDRFSIQFKAGGTTDFRLFVDDMEIDLPGWNHTTGAGTYYYTWIFNTFKLRRIHWYGGQSIGLYGVIVPGGATTSTATGTMWPTEARRSVIMNGDSYLHGGSASSEGGAANFTINGGTICQEFAIQSGWDVINMGQGGTGYLSNASGLAGCTVYGSDDRLAALAALPQSDMLLFYGGGNDTLDDTPDVAAIVAAANIAWDKWATARPASKFVVNGFEAGDLPQHPAAGMHPANTGIKAAAAANGNVDWFIDQWDSPSPWIYGTGMMNDRNNDGNQDIMVSSDEVHGTHGGFEYLAYRMIQAMRGMPL